MSDKINPHHLARKAVLYVRQSSSYQVNYHEESRRLQYAMRERLEQLGWEEIEVIDEDLGRSAAGNVERRGLNAWSPRSVWGRSEPWRPEKFRGLLAIVASGSDWSRFAGLWTRC